MARRTVTFESTPNPNAVKCLVSPPLRDPALPPRSYFNAEAARGDALAAALFEIPGVTNILDRGDFVTIGKSPGADWRAVKAAAKRLLEAHGDAP